ncbi:hypothetical protein GCM10020370_48850 [Paenibacillus hodogayensis]
MLLAPRAEERVNQLGAPSCIGRAGAGEERRSTAAAITAAKIATTKVTADLAQGRAGDDPHGSGFVGGGLITGMRKTALSGFV